MSECHTLIYRFSYSISNNVQFYNIYSSHNKQECVPALHHRACTQIALRIMMMMMLMIIINRKQMKRARDDCYPWDVRTGTIYSNHYWAEPQTGKTGFTPYTTRSSGNQWPIWQFWINYRLNPYSTDSVSLPSEWGLTGSLLRNFAVVSLHNLAGSCTSSCCWCLCQYWTHTVLWPRDRKEQFLIISYVGPSHNRPRVVSSSTG